MNEASITPVWLTAALLMGFLCTAAACAEEVTPPLLQIGQIEAVEIDGRIGAEEWAGATDPGVLVSPDGRPDRHQVHVRVAWDEHGLAVLWELPGEAEYKRRDRDGELWRDDSVAIVLQAEEGAPVHRFAINAGGSIYDARDDDEAWDAAWRGLALRGADGWRVEMHIPFAAIDARPGDTLRANLIVNDGETDSPAAAWAPVGETGEERFGYLRLSDAPSQVTLGEVRIDRDSVTVVPHFSGPAVLRAALFGDEGELQTLETRESTPLEMTLPDPGKFRLRVAGTGPDGELVLQREFPLVRISPLAVSARKRLLSAREIDLLIDGEGLSVAPDGYVITAPGAEAIAVAPDGRVARATVDLSACTPGEMTVTVTALAGEEEVASETLSFTLPPRPEWADSERGKHARLMEPWTPVEVRGSRVRCRDRVYDLGDEFLPVSIKSGGRELLAGPVALRATAGSAARGWDEATVRWLEKTETHADAALSARTPGAEARVRMSCSYDGLMTFNVKVNPVGDRALSEVRLAIPVAAEFASHVQIAGGADESVATSVGREEHTQAFAPMVWLSGHERGLQWLCASDASWALEEPERAINITPGRGQTALVVTMLDRELLPGESFETSFGLQATPVVPRRDDWREWRTATLHGLPMPEEDEGAEALVGRIREHGVQTIVLDDENYRPRPDGLGAEADSLLAEFAQICHDAGLGLVMVIDDDLTRDPVWRAFGDEVAVNAGVDDGALRPCPGSAWADYVVEAAAYAMEHYEANGIHLRGGLSTLDCGQHAEGGSCATRGSRELMMRLRTVVRESRPDGLLTVELPAGTPAAAAGFADSLVVAGSAAGGDALSVDEFVALGGTGALGTAVEVAAGPAEMQHAIRLALVHDVALRPETVGAGPAVVEKVREVREKFNVKTANWAPWWSGRVPVTTEAADVRVSAWWRDGEVLAVVANLGDDAPVVELALDRERLELAPWLQAVDRLDGQAVRQIGEVLRMRMEAGQVSLIHVQTRDERNVDIDE
ncbi:MAG: DUF6067 family protein [Armatimonadota bacterium]